MAQSCQHNIFMQTNTTTTETTANHVLDPHLWVERYADYLYGFALVRLSNQELARDLVQETFLAALEKQQAFEGRSTEKTWLTAILKNKIIDVYRARGSARAKSESLLEAESR